MARRDTERSGTNQTQGRPESAQAAGGRRIVVICSLTASLVNFRYELLKSMVECGYEVTALGPEMHEPTIEALSRIGVAFERIPMVRAGVDPLGDVATLWALWTKLRRISPDIVLCYTMKPVIYGLIAAQLAGIRRRFALMTGLGYVFSGDATNRRLPWVRRIATVLYRIALRGTEPIFVYNTADRDEMITGRMVREPARLVLVPGSGIDLQRFSETPVPAGTPVFLLIARLLREKGVREFAAAARSLKARYPQARFRILGPQDPGPLAITGEEIAKWSEDGVIEYLGETADVRPYLAACSVFILPSYYREGIPRSILEAMAMGRAILTADTPGCRDTVEEGENGFLVPPRSTEALAEAMQRFLDDPRLAGVMGRKSRAIAEARFDVHEVNRLLLERMQVLQSADGEA